MKKKLESLYDQSLADQTSLVVLKKQKKGLFPKSLSEQENPPSKVNNDVKSIRDVLFAYGKNAALSAKLGSFENLRTNLVLPETGQVSLYSYKFLKNSNILMLFIPDYNIELRLINSKVFIGGKTLQISATQTVKTTITEPVRIGKDEENKAFIQKVNFPLTVIKLEYVTSLSGNDAKDLSVLVLNSLFRHYNTNTASGVFTQSILDSKSDYLTQELPNDNSFGFILEYQKRATV